MNSKVRAIPYKPGHLDCIEAKEVFESEEAIATRIAQISPLPGVHIETILFGRIPVAIMGLNHMRDGVAEVWTVISERAKEHPMSFHRAVLGRLHAYEKKMKLVRMSMTVREDFEEGIRWAELLGFEREGLMKRFGPNGQNHFLYARTNECPIQ